MILSTILKFQSKHAEEMDALIQSEALFARVGRDEVRAMMLHSIGINYCTQQKYSEAEECYILAQAIFLSIERPDFESTALVGLGNLYVHQGRYGEALPGRVFYALQSLTRAVKQLNWMD